jgi:TatD DNase family protein
MSETSQAGNPQHGGYIDTHCHLFDTRGVEVADVIAAARAAGVTTMITVGCDAASTEDCIAIAAANSGIYATAGVHPHEAVQGVDSILGFLDDPHVIAIGECGLDYFYDHSPREAQRVAFAAQIALAHQRGLPLVVHTRDAWDDTFDVFAAEGVPEQTVFHCFTGGLDEARRCLDLGAYLSFSGIVTFKAAAELRNAARLCPADRILAETDSPYLAPVPHRGRTNQPSFVTDVVAQLASVRETPVHMLRDDIARNARLAFPLLRT